MNLDLNVDVVLKLQATLSRNNLAVERAKLVRANYLKLKLDIFQLHINDEFLLNYLTFMKEFRINTKVDSEQKTRDLQSIAVQLVSSNLEFNEYEMKWWNEVFEEKNTMSVFADRVKSIDASVLQNPNNLKHYAALQGTYAFLAKYDKKYIRAMQKLNEQVMAFANACICCDNRNDPIEIQKVKNFCDVLNKFSKILNPEYVPVLECTWDGLDHELY